MHAPCHEHRVLLVLLVLALASSALLAQDVVEATRNWQDALEPAPTLVGERWYGFYFGNKNSGYLHFNVQPWADGGGYLVEVDGSLEMGAAGEQVVETLYLDSQLRLVRAEQSKTSEGTVRQRLLTPGEGGISWSETLEGETTNRQFKVDREPAGSLVHGLLLFEAHGGRSAGELAFVRISEGELLNVDMVFSGEASLETRSDGEHKVWTAVLDEGARVTQVTLAADGRVLRFGPDPRIRFLLVADEEQARADLGEALVVDTDSPRAAVVDFLHGLLGDDARYERCAVWPELSENRWVAAMRAQDIEVTAEMRASYRTAATVAKFQADMRASASHINEDLVSKVIGVLAEAIDGETATVVEPGGLTYELRAVDGSWKIVDFQTPAQESSE